MNATCSLGGGEFGGLNLRHLILAEGMSQTIFSYQSRYAHQIPSPLDPYVFLYQSLEIYSATTNMLTPEEVSFDRRNEPDMVCKCMGTENDNGRSIIEL